MARFFLRRRTDRCGWFAAASMNSSRSSSLISQRPPSWDALRRPARHSLRIQSLLNRGSNPAASSGVKYVGNPLSAALTYSGDVA